MASSVVLKSLSILLGIFFIFVGTTKLTPNVSKELYKELRKEFVKYSKVFPLSGILQFKVPSKWYRRTVGGMEVLCGMCLTFVPSQKIKKGANYILVAMMLFAAYNHYMVGDKFERLAPSLVFFFMLTCRLIVEYQIKRKERLAKESPDKDQKKDSSEMQTNVKQVSSKPNKIISSKVKKTQ